MPARVLASEQDRELERIAEADAEKLLHRRLSDRQVPALERSAEDGAQVL